MKTWGEMTEREIEIRQEREERLYLRCPICGEVQERPELRPFHRVFAHGWSLSPEFGERLREIVGEHAPLSGLIRGRALSEVDTEARAA